MRKGSVMGSLKACLSPQACFVLEAQRIVRAASSPQPGDGIKAQIRRAGTNLGISFGMAWRAWHGRIGARAFPKLYRAWLAFDQRQTRIGHHELAALHERIARLERGEGTHSQDSGLGKPPDSQSAVAKREHPPPHRP